MQGVKEERRLFHEQCVRAVGVAIVLHGSMHPAMELLLRHAIQYFGEWSHTRTHTHAHAHAHAHARTHTDTHTRIYIYRER